MEDSCNIISTLEAVEVLLSREAVSVIGPSYGFQTTLLQYVAQLRRAGGMWPINRRVSPSNVTIWIGELDRPVAANHFWWPVVTSKEYSTIKLLIQRSRYYDILDAEIGQGER